jgi:hypothetical protein
MCRDGLLRGSPRGTESDAEGRTCSEAAPRTCEGCARAGAAPRNCVRCSGAGAAPRNCVQGRRSPRGTAWDAQGRGPAQELRAMQRGRAHRTSESFLRNVVRCAVAVHIAQTSSRACCSESSLWLPYLIKGFHGFCDAHGRCTSHDIPWLREVRATGISLVHSTSNAKNYSILYALDTDFASADSQAGNRP